MVWAYSSVAFRPGSRLGPDVAFFSQPILFMSRKKTARRLADFFFASQILLRQFTKCIGHGAGQAQRHRPISDRLPAKAIADGVDGAVGRPARQSSPCAGAAAVVRQGERQFELKVPASFEMRDGDGEQRDESLA